MQPAILIVDDVPGNLLALEATLEPLGFHTVRANSGEEAVRITASREFAAILMDVRMPGMDGLEAASVIRRRPQGPDVPIVLMSAIDRDLVHIERGYQAGAIDYLVKPFDPQALRAKVTVLVELWQARQAERRENEQRYWRLLTWLGHELRNPLSALLSVMELRQRKAAVVTEWEETIERQVSRLKALAGELTRLEMEGREPPSPINGHGGPLAAPVDHPRVLLVDDNEDGLHALADLLRDAGVDVATASSAGEALRVVGDFRPGAAIVDIGLPDLDGHELGRRLRAAVGNKQLRVFALSGFGTRDDLERSRGAGFDDHFVKPPELPALLKALGVGGRAG